MITLFFITQSIYSHGSPVLISILSILSMLLRKGFIFDTHTIQPPHLYCVSCSFIFNAIMWYLLCLWVMFLLKLVKLWINSYFIYNFLLYYFLYLVFGCLLLFCRKYVEGPFWRKVKENCHPIQKRNKTFGFLDLT